MNEAFKPAKQHYYIPPDMTKWREIITAWDASKESQKNYCQRLGINLNTFTHARSKLLLNEKTKIKTQFIPLTVNSKEKPENLVTSLITLENSHGFKLHLSPSLSLEQLTKLFKLAGWEHA